MHHKISLTKCTGDFLVRVNVGDTILFDHISRVSFSTEYPVRDHRSFKRGSFHVLDFQLSTYHGWTGKMECRLPGAFTCRVSFSSTPFDLRIVVQPSMHVPLQSIVMQTLITKLLGPISCWNQYFSSARSSGINTVHLTPVQILGDSCSSYCIKDHLTLSPSLFTGMSIPSIEHRFDALKSSIFDCKNKLNLRFIVDVVYNHAAADSDWLADHPECLFNLYNSPHLKSAFVLDEVLMKGSGGGVSRSVDQLYFLHKNDIKEVWHTDGTSEVPPLLEGIVIDSPDALSRVLNILKQELIPKAKIWEFYVVNKIQTLVELRNRLTNSLNATAKVKVNLPSPNEVLEKLKNLNAISSTFSGNRDQYFISIPCFVKALEVDESHGVAPDSLLNLIELSSKVIDLLNVERYKDYDSDIFAALCAVEGALRYKHLADHGPLKRDPISARYPLVDPLFTRIQHPSGCIIPVANNGWVMGHRPAAQPDFVAPFSKSYIRREVIVWGDNVKLRYGASVSDAPFLWNMMESYTKQMAIIFDGFRIDNCHSTPLHVAEYLLDQARKVNPNIFIVAELFTGSLHADLGFVRKLGINALVREAARADDSSSFSRMLWECAAADPVGSICKTPLVHRRMGNLLSILYDSTHDNEPPAIIRTPQDALSTLALVSGVPCPIGTVRGYDDLTPHRVCVVEETRKYATNPATLSPIRSFFSTLRLKLIRDNFSEFHVSTHDSGTIVIHRHCSKTLSSIFIIARTAFKDSNDCRSFDITLPGAITKFRFYASMQVADDAVSNFKKDSNFVNGIEATVNYQHSGDLPSNIRVKLLDPRTRTERSVINFSRFEPGSVVVFEGLPTVVADLLRTSDRSLSDLLNPPSIPQSVLNGLTFEDLHSLLYISAAELRKPMYWIPAHGELPYAGVAGWKSVLSAAKNSGNAGHPVLEHLRAGAWAVDFLYDRVGPLKSAIKPFVNTIKQLPWSLTPLLFTKLIDFLYRTLTDAALEMMTPWLRVKIHDDSCLPGQLALTSLQMVSSSQSLISDPSVPPIPSMAAGLPHFAEGYMRAWGRDTFIALPGLLLVTGRFDDAKQIILHCARTLRHGLIPNLLNGGDGSRYNCRDATWFFIHSIKSYCHAVPNGHNILAEKVPLICANDDAPVILDGSKSERILTLSDVIYEIFCRHALGIHFRERNAGRQIDDRMQDEGFNINLYLDSTNGFIYGGNRFNCLTWCDKMGSSDKAHNRGIPSTPRDGAPIDMVAALASALELAIELNEKNMFPEGVKLPDGRWLTFSNWLGLIQRNFDRFFWIPDNSDQDEYYGVDKTLVNRRGIYRDVVGSFHNWTTYQLRSQASMAMALCPRLFDKDKAVKHLILASEVLLKGAMPGLRTLDPSDSIYRIYYDQSDNDDYYSSGGFSYHNGPSWGFVGAFHCKALLTFDCNNNHGLVSLAEECFASVKTHLDSNPFLGVSELWHGDASFCAGSCKTQAWSSGVYLEALKCHADLVGRKQ
ncbi:hypothetical protein RCL1_004381 [Eukaryota sp. TZLM3-RCL]